MHPIITSYCILFVVFYTGKRYGKTSKLFIANHFLIAFGALYLLLSKSVQFFSAWYFGFLLEFIAIKSPIYLILDLALLIFPLANFSYKFRSKNIYQWAIFLCFLAFILSHLIPYFHFSWQSSVGSNSSMQSRFGYLLVAFILNYLLVYHKALKEFQTDDKHDPLYDALVDKEK